MSSSKALDLLFTFQFLRYLITPFNKTDAFKMGAIDADGNVLKKRKDLTAMERDRYTVFHVLIFNLKRLLGKIPGGKHTLASFTAALLLLREHMKYQMYDVDALEKAFYQHLNQSNIQLDEDYSNEVAIQLAFDPFVLNEMRTILNDDAPINNVGGGNVAGTIGDPPGSCKKSPLLRRKKKKNKKKETMKESKVPERNKPFMGCEVFDVDGDRFHKCTHGKQKYHRYHPYVGDDSMGEEIRVYGRENPKAGIILRHDQTGAMIFLRRPVSE